MFLKIGLTAAIVGFSLGGQTTLSGPVRPLTVCEVLSQSAAYNGKMVTLKGVDASTDEGLWVRGISCLPITIGGREWPPVVSLVTPDMALEETDFEFDEASWTRVGAEYKRRLSALPRNCVEFTYTGLFQTRSNWENFKLVYPDGRILYLGYGHLNFAPAQLIVKSADRVDSLPDCKR